MQVRFDIRPKVRADQISNLFRAARDFVHYAPNADLGEASPRENLRSAFYIVRCRLERGMSIQQATGDLDRIAFSMADM